jgi:hypothetical protein
MFDGTNFSIFMTDIKLGEISYFLSTTYFTAGLASFSQS